MRRGMPHRNVDPFSMLPVFLPFNGDPVSSILCGQAQRCWQSTRSERFEPNQTDASYRHSIHQLWPERAWEDVLQQCRSNTIIDENTPINDALNGWKIHLVHLSILESSQCDNIMALLLILFFRL